MAKIKKTNVMRILDKHKVTYRTHTYDASDESMDGVDVAHAVGMNPDIVFKTLVTQGNSKEYYVFVVPVNKTLNLKKAAKASGEKKIEMIPMKKLLSITGFIHGGCSPVGMKKPFKTFIHDSVIGHENMVCSAGKRGLQVDVKVNDLIEIVKMQIVDVCD